MNWHRYGRRKKEFLAQIERIVLWKEWLKLIQPCYYKGERGNKPYPLEIMLRLYLLQNLYDLSDKATVAEAIDSRAFSDFWGLILKKGTIVDSTIIAAPSSTKNKEKKRDPEAHQVKKGNTWHFGYKAHIGVDKDSGLVHTVEATASNVHDVTEASRLLTGDEDEVYGDSGYLGAGKREDAVVENKSGQKIQYKINTRPSQIKKLSKEEQAVVKEAEHAKSSARAKVEHVFGVVKKQLRFRKTRYRGIEKQKAKFNIMFALANLILADRPCLAARVSALTRAKIWGNTKLLCRSSRYLSDFNCCAVLPLLHFRHHFWLMALLYHIRQRDGSFD